MIRKQGWNFLAAGLCIIVGMQMIAGCHAESKEKPIHPKEIVLQDVQGLFGGQNVYLFNDGTVWVQVVRPPQAGQTGFFETRYKLALNGKKVSELEKLLNEHHFAAIQINDRPGVPDEARPAIRVTDADGRVIEKQKWANDQNPDFDSIYQWFLDLIPKDGAQKPTSAGPYNLAWHPDAPTTQPVPQGG